MRFYSTSRFLPSSSFRSTASFREALFRGLAPDSGLFMPERLPSFSAESIKALGGKSYAEVAHTVLEPFLNEDLSDELIRKLMQDAYPFAVRLQEYDDRTMLAWMDQGPTASFKDFAASFLAQAMASLKKKGERITVLVATSGDTGSAIGEALRGTEGVDVFILYPEDEVSQVQRKHMDTIGENVRALSVKGKFDDCQRLVKRAFADPDLQGLNLTSANSINIGRILAQIVYYFYIYANTGASSGPVVFSIPSGNFGNSFGCELARRMGLPVKKMILAVNANDEFPRYLASGAYTPLSLSRACLSNAMNVGNPSNLARYFDIYGGSMDKEGKVSSYPPLEIMRQNLASYSISDEETLETMRRAHKEKDIMLDPHGAVGLAALARYREDTADSAFAVSMETAHPGKFPDIIQQALGKEPPFPPSFVDMAARKGEALAISSGYSDLKRLLIKGERA